MAFNRLYIIIPIPIILLEKLLAFFKIPLSYKQVICKLIVWLVTYYFYSAIYFAYIPLGAVKGTLNPPCLLDNANRSATGVKNSDNCTGWEPFIGDYGNTLLGALDFLSLFTFAIGIFIAGNIADYFDDRLVICICGVLLFTSSTLFGTGYYTGIHSFAYYLVSHTLIGVGAAASPAVIGALGKWVHGKRSGIILGLWSSCFPLSKIIGLLITSIWSDYAWGASFYSSSVLSGSATILALLFLVPDPSYIEEFRRSNCPQDTIPEETARNVKKMKTIRIWRVSLIPELLEYFVSLFFVAWAYYTLLVWLSYIIRNTQIEGVSYPTSVAAQFSIIFDIGSIAGSIICGGVSDLIGSRSIVISFNLYATIVLFFLYQLIGTVHLGYNLTVLFLIGFSLGGAHVIIFSCVTVDLGSKHESKTNTKAISSVSGVIASSGGVGGAVGSLVTGVLFQFGVSVVLYSLMTAVSISALILLRITIKDSVKLYHKIRPRHYVYTIN